MLRVAYELFSVFSTRMKFSILQISDNRQNDSEDGDQDVSYAQVDDRIV